MIVLQDRDLTLHQGDIRDVLAELEPGSVDCVITSPPYWGLRDYQTGGWDGGDPGCEHRRPSTKVGAATTLRNDGRTHRGLYEEEKAVDPGYPFREVCGKCGARRVDNQIGLEATPDAYVAGMVELFRLVWRALAPHGTCWINLGDSYAATLTSDRHSTQPTGPNGTPATKHGPHFGGQRTAIGGLKPKDLCMIPARVAIALQADGWYLRSDIIWAKPNPMPESVTDRPTSAHEHVFLLAKQPRYWFDAEAVREPHARLWDSNNGGSWAHTDKQPNGSKAGHHSGDYPLPNPAGRNIRNVWEIATQPYPDAHFATYPEELVRRCLLAGCPLEVCRVCRKPRERIVEASYENPGNRTTNGPRSLAQRHETPGFEQRLERRSETLGFTDCGHDNYRAGVVLDPFAGSGTTLKVARDHGRHSIGIELSPAYVALIARRVQQLSLLAEARR